jgi:hypothetical protein
MSAERGMFQFTLIQGVVRSGPTSFAKSARMLNNEL